MTDMTEYFKAQIDGCTQVPSMLFYLKDDVIDKIIYYGTPLTISNVSFVEIRNSIPAFASIVAF